MSLKLAKMLKSEPAFLYRYKVFTYKKTIAFIGKICYDNCDSDFFTEV